MKYFLLVCSVISSLAATPALEFEQNAGQAPADIQFFAHKPGGQILLRAAGMEFRGGGTESVRWEWVGASPDGAWRGVAATGNSVSYLLGNDRRRWVQNAPSYAKIQRDGLYPGVHWTAYVQNGQLEYDLTLDPGADAARVLLRVHGARAALRDGSIVTREGGLRVAQHPPHLYQVIDGERRSIRGRFVARGEGLFGLQIDAYRRDLPLVVDPVIDAVFSYSGPDDERVVADCGQYSVGVTRLAAGRNSDLFIRRQTEAGINTIFWGGDGDEEATSCSDGVIGGWTTSRNLPAVNPENRRFQGQFGGGESDGFVLMMQFNEPSYATYVGGTGRDRVNAVRMISDRDVVIGWVIAGETDSVSWNGLDVDQRGRGAMDAFVGQMRGGRPILLTFGGERDDRATAVAVIDTQTFAVAGSTESADFPLSDAVQQQRSGPSDAWLAQVVWPTEGSPRIARSTLWGGSGDERTGSLWSVPEAGLYLSGTTTSPDLSVTGTSRYGGGASDGFITRFSTDGKRVLASTFLGGSGDDELLCATLRGRDLVVGGATTSADFPIRGGAVQDKQGGGKDGFAAHLDASGRVVWSTFWGGEDEDAVLAMSAQTTEALRLGGWTRSRAWLRELHAAERLASNHAPAPPAGRDGFLAEIKYSYASAPDLVIGKDLQAALPLTVISEPGANGILTVRSADPAKLLVSLSPETEGSEQVTVFDADVQTPGSVTAVFVQALDAGSETEVILSGRSYPDRRVHVRLLPSALFVGETEAAVQTLAGNNGMYSGSVFAAAVDDQTGQRLGQQPVRAGLDPGIQVRSSDESGLKPEYSPSNGYSRATATQTFQFQPVREGVYTLTPSSSVFAAAPGQQVTVRVDTRTWPVTRIYLARGARALVPLNLSMGSRLHVVSEDPSKLMVSAWPTVAAQPEVDYPPSSSSYSGIFVNALADQGEAVIRVEGPEGRQARVIVAMAPLEISMLPSATVIPVNQILRVILRARPTGAPPAGFMAPEQWLWPAAFPSFSSAPAILQNRGVGLRNWDWVAELEGLAPGTATVRFDEPDYGTARPRPFQVQVTSGGIWFDGGELLLPEGAMRNFNPTTYLGDQAAQSVSFSIRDASVATFDIGQTKITTDPRRGLQMYGVGKAGDQTVLTVSARGMPETTIPVRIVPKVLLPDLNEALVNGSRTITFHIAALHPATGAPLPGYFRTVAYGAIPVRVEAEPAGICEFPGEVNTFMNVTCSGSGETIIRVQPLSGFGPTPEFGRIRIVANGRSSRAIMTGSGTSMPTRALLGNRLQTALEIPAGVIGPITLTSRDPAKVRLSATMAGPVGDRLTVERSQTIYLHGFASEGTATVSADAANIGLSDTTVHLFPPVMALRTGSGGGSAIREVRVPLSQSVLSLTASPGLLDPSSGSVYTSAAIRMGAGIEPFLVAPRSSDSAVAEPQPPTPLFGEGTTSQQATFRLRRAGVADLSLTPPEGFVAAPGAAMRVRVYEPTLRFSERVVLDKDLMQRVSVLGRVDGFDNRITGDVTVTSLDPDKVLVSASDSISGQTSVTGPAFGSFYLQALTGEGPARLRLQAAGYEDSVISVEFLPAALGLDTAYFAWSPGVPVSVRLRYAPMERDRLLPSWSGGVRPSVALRIRYRSGNSAVVQVPDPGEKAFVPGVEWLELPFRTVAPGDTELTVEAPPGIRTTVERIPIRVNRWTFSTQSYVTVGRFLTAPLDLGAPGAAPTVARATLTGGATLLLSLDQTKSGEASVALPMAGAARTTLHLQPVGAGNRSEVTLSAPDFEDLRVQVDIVDPQFAFQPARGANLDVNLSAATVSVPIVVAPAGYSTTPQPLGPSRGAVRLELKSSNPAVLKPGVDWLEFQPGESLRNLTLQLVGRGDAVLTLQAPAGFNLPAGKHEILVTVR